MTVLYHYTSRMNAWHIAKDEHTLYPINDLAEDDKFIEEQPDWVREGFSLVWLTDLDLAHAPALGLTLHSNWATRTQVRFTVADDRNCIPWAQYRLHANPVLVAALEERDGAMPAHWWVSKQPVKVIALKETGNDES